MKSLVGLGSFLGRNFAVQPVSKPVLGDLARVWVVGSGAVGKAVAATLPTTLNVTLVTEFPPNNNQVILKRTDGTAIQRDVDVISYSDMKSSVEKPVMAVVCRAVSTKDTVLSDLPKCTTVHVVNGVDGHKPLQGLLNRPVIRSVAQVGFVSKRDCVQETFNMKTFLGYNPVSHSGYSELGIQNDLSHAKLLLNRTFSNLEISDRILEKAHQKAILNLSNLMTLNLFLNHPEQPKTYDQAKENLSFLGGLYLEEMVAELCDLYQIRDVDQMTKDVLSYMDHPHMCSTIQQVFLQQKMPVDLFPDSKDKMPIVDGFNARLMKQSWGYLNGV